MGDSRVMALKLGAAVGCGVAVGYWLGCWNAKVKNVESPVTIVVPPGTDSADVDERPSVPNNSVRVVTATDVVDIDDVRIREYTGGASTGMTCCSIAHVVVKRTWSEEWQKPEFDEWTILLKGVVRIERAQGVCLNVREGEAVFLPRGEWVRWVFPDPSALPEYIAICTPAFSPDNCGRCGPPELSQQPEYETFSDLYHAAPKAAWELAVAAGKPYYPDTYDADGFVHATAKGELLLPVLNHFYQEKPGDFICLRMSRLTLSNLGVRVCFEFPAAVGDKATFSSRKYGATLFPHIYSGISTQMVSQILPITRSEAGEFLSVKL